MLFFNAVVLIRYNLTYNVFHHQVSDNFLARPTQVIGSLLLLLKLSKKNILSTRLRLRGRLPILLIYLYIIPSLTILPIVILSHKCPLLTIITTTSLSFFNHY